MSENYQTFTTEYDECISKGLCSINPVLSALQEVVLLHLKELSFYLLKLKAFGVTNNQVREMFIDALTGIIINAEYNQEQFQDIISKLDYNIEQAKILYKNFCESSGEEAQSVKLYFKHSRDFNLSNAIKKGEKYFIKKSLTLTPKQKGYFDIMLILAKSMCLKIIEIRRLGQEYDYSYYAILGMINRLNFSDFSEDLVKKEIDEFIKVYYNTVIQIFDKQIEKYGQMGFTEVSFSTVPGKAILVSGTDFKKLEDVLKATEGTEISVYTHGLEMLMSHAFPKLHSHPNLKGHFGVGLETSLIDFAEFPGAILMTKATLFRPEYLYRGRLFTLDPIAPAGIIKLKENNYEPLIKSALEGKGFTNSNQKPPMKVGFHESQLNEKIDTIIEKMQKNEIKHLFIIGLINTPNAPYRQYFEQFFELLPKDCYAISLCCDIKRENVFHLDSFYGYYLFFKVLAKLQQKIDIKQVNISVFLTRCDKNTISNLLYLKHIGIKNVYMCKCPPTLINPVIIETLQESFDIKELSTAKEDLERILKL